MTYEQDVVISRVVPEGLFCRAFDKQVRILDTAGLLPICEETLTGVCDNRMCIWSQGVAVGCTARAEVSGSDRWKERDFAFYKSGLGAIDWCEPAWDSSKERIPFSTLVADLSDEDVQKCNIDMLEHVISEAVLRTVKSGHLIFWDFQCQDYPDIVRKIPIDNIALSKWVEKCTRDFPDILFWMGPYTMCWFLLISRRRDLITEPGKRLRIKLDSDIIEQILYAGRNKAIQRLFESGASDITVSSVWQSVCHKLAWAFFNRQPPIIYPGKTAEEENLKDSSPCDICNRSIYEPGGHQITTTQVVTNSKYWNYVFEQSSSPMSAKQQCDEHSVSYYKFIADISIKRARDNTAWLVCDRCCEMLGVSEPLAAEYANKFWKCGRNWSRDDAGPAEEAIAMAAATEGFRQTFGPLSSSEEAPTLLYAYGNGYYPTHELGMRISCMWFTDMASGYDDAAKVLHDVPILLLRSAEVASSQWLEEAKRIWREIKMRHSDAFVTMTIICNRTEKPSLPSRAEWLDEINKGVLSAVVFHGKAAEIARARDKLKTDAD